MSAADDKRSTFRALHVKGSPLIMPNPWDRGSARLLESLGFRAVATTSGGFAASLGRVDYSVSRDEAVQHAASIVAAVEVPVSADLENCFADDPAGVAVTVERARDAGLAGCSVEDFTTRPDAPVYELALATERVSAAAEAAHVGPGPGLVLTARAENYLRGRPDLDDTVRRLQAYQEAGADVLYAPGLSDPGQIRSIVESLDRPVNVLTVRGAPAVPELAAAGVGRISIGGAFHAVALGAVAEAARELLDQGTYGWLDGAAQGRRAVTAAFAAR
ncbi:MAG TPA: isocitrate lyase/phosphoenolpyruvate mutase family protein [Acidimicrobiales bacterium]|nr:isocitrate lyase/phosphoenolpyruvate mutase family protein [Acidimicrobiales bacterium]